VKYSLPKGPSLAAFFAESIQGVGGTVQYPNGFLAKAFERTRELGGLCVSDEVIKVWRFNFSSKNICSFGIF
jgi:alanine-glyoxylate transaminase/(R)-3-amino-2-methylpropionate-pyruvate transaminase